MPEPGAYTAVVRSAMNYGPAVWHAPKELKAMPDSVENKLSVVQNKCLQMVSDIYKATSIKALEVETYVSSIMSRLLQLQATPRYRMRSTG